MSLCYPYSKTRKPHPLHQSIHTALSHTDSLIVLVGRIQIHLKARPRPHALDTHFAANEVAHYDGAFDLFAHGDLVGVLLELAAAYGEAAGAVHLYGVGAGVVGVPLAENAVAKTDTAAAFDSRHMDGRT